MIVIVFNQGTFSIDRKERVEDPAVGGKRVETKIGIQSSTIVQLFYGVLCLNTFWTIIIAIWTLLYSFYLFQPV